MKTRHILISAILALFSSIAVAGLVSPVEVVIDDNNKFAHGDMWTARTADNNVEAIGCGIKLEDVGAGGVSTFGFCQAVDADDVYVGCITFNEELVEAIKSISDFSYILFSWDENGECTRIDISTQSVYLPKFKVKKDMDDDDD